jgi:hypothetical protein
MDGDAHISPWINADDLDKSGGIIIWCIKCNRKALTDNVMPDYLQKSFPLAKVQEPLTMSRMTLADIPPVVVGWAVVPPAVKAP